jgi:hypothetical protein
MRTREEVREFIRCQLEKCSKDPRHKREGRYLRKDLEQWHYGKCELKDLLDFIFGEYKEENDA